MSKLVTVSVMQTQELCIKVGGVPVAYASNPEDGRRKVESLHESKVLNETQRDDAKRLLTKLEQKEDEVRKAPRTPNGVKQDAGLRLVS